MSQPPEQTLVNAEFELQLQTGKMRVVLPVPEQPVGMTALLPILQHFTSAVAQQTAGAMAERGQPVQCGPRCSACCHQLVPVSPFEAEALAQWIRSLPADQQATLAMRFQRALLALQERGVLERLTPEFFTLPPDAMGEVNRMYFTAGVACPFLVDHNCSIHPIRPLICREYMVVTPPAYCSEPGHPRAEVVVPPVRPSRGLMKLGRRVQGDEQGWLPLVFLISWMGAGIEPGKAVFGPGPAVLREFIDAL